MQEGDQDQDKKTKINKDLYQACEAGNEEQVADLLDQQADPNYVGGKYEGRTSLHIASRRGHVAIVEKLLLCGAVVDTLGKYEDTPLMYAAAEGHVKVAEIMLDQNANIDVQDVHGFTALHFACLKGKDEVVEMLLERDADHLLKSKLGMTPIDWSVRGTASESSRERIQAIFKEFQEKPKQRGKRAKPSC